MNAAIVVIVKNEELYIDEWVKYHLDLGFNHIYIYDDNDNFGKLDYLNNDKVSVIKYEVSNQIEKITGNKKLVYKQKNLYKNSYKEYSETYDWIAFIDCDEYITIKEKTIQEYLNRFYDTDIIHLQWLCYGDNDQIYYENKPVIERFTKHITKNAKHYCIPANMYIKSIIRTKKEPIFQSAHTAIIKNSICKLGDGSVHDCKYIFNDKYNYDDAYIRHYLTKSLEEYLIRRNYKNNEEEIIDKVKQYFLFNEKTKEKIDYIESKFPNISWQFLK